MNCCFSVAGFPSSSSAASSSSLAEILEGSCSPSSEFPLNLAAIFESDESDYH
jgi:hypothetical protein